MSDTVVVIGSNSFSGGDFIDHLLEATDHEIVGISRSEENTAAFLAYRLRDDRTRYSFHQLDLNGDIEAILALLAERRPRFVVNFASQSEVAASWETPEQWFQTNAVSTAQLGNFLRQQSWLERYVHISTPEVYGSCEGNITETSPMNPSTPYAASRAAGEMMLNTLVKEFSFPVSMVRSTNVYGARQQLFKIIPRAIIKIRKGETIQLHGGGAQVRSFIHIRDVSAGELAVMNGGGVGDVYNLSPDGDISIRDLVKLICDTMSVDFEACTESTPARPGNDARYVIDSTKARKAFGWLPKIALEQGIAETIDWVDEYWDELTQRPMEYVHKP